ncbi:MAG TPA: DUF951 domain-containing protein [Chthonomonadales bacterium]|nr:DUF951 domain-containing protein [Chthonomonadales bacterium]
MAARLEIFPGLRVKLRKKHPCGADEWTVTRTGADVGIRCAGCGRRVMLDREEFERRVRTVLPAGADGSGRKAEGNG